MGFQDFIFNRDVHIQRMMKYVQGFLMKYLNIKMDWQQKDHNLIATISHLLFKLNVSTIGCIAFKTV